VAPRTGGAQRRNTPHGARKCTAAPTQAPPPLVALSRLRLADRKPRTLLRTGRPLCCLESCAQSQIPRLLTAAVAAAAHARAEQRCARALPRPRVQPLPCAAEPERARTPPSWRRLRRAATALASTHCPWRPACARCARSARAAAPAARMFLRRRARCCPGSAPQKLEAAGFMTRGDLENIGPIDLARGACGVSCAHSEKQRILFAAPPLVLTPAPPRRRGGADARGGAQRAAREQQPLRGAVRVYGRCAAFCARVRVCASASRRRLRSAAAPACSRPARLPVPYRPACAHLSAAALRAVPLSAPFPPFRARRAAPTSALELLQAEQRRRHIITFCADLDGLLGGGVAPGEITECVCFSDWLSLRAALRLLTRRPRLRAGSVRAARRCFAAMRVFCSHMTRCARPRTRRRRPWPRQDAAQARHALSLAYTRLRYSTLRASDLASHCRTALSLAQHPALRQRAAAARVWRPGGRSHLHRCVRQCVRGAACLLHAQQLCMIC
jgi:hypothetical protein